MILKPCPFCGYAATVKEGKESLPQSGGDYAFFIAVSCSNRFCSIKPEVCRKGETGYPPYRPEEARTNDQAREEAYAAWNNRKGDLP